MLAFANDARAVSLADGVQAYEDMDLDVAAEKLAKALRTSEAKDKPRVELWLAIVELERGNEATARRWLKSALRADPTLTVEHELSPKILSMIENVRAQVSPPSSSASQSASQSGESASAPAAIALVAPIATAPVAGPPPPTSTSPPAVAAHLAEPVAATVATTPNPSTSSSSDVVASQSAIATTPANVGEDTSSSLSPLVYVTAATGAVSAGALVGGAVLGTVARIGGEAAEREPVAAIATERYQEASTAAFTANSLFIAGGVAAIASVVCGVLVFVDDSDREGEGEGEVAALGDAQ